MVRNSHHQALSHLPHLHDPSNFFDTTNSFTLRSNISDDDSGRLKRHGPSTRHRRGFSFRPGDDTKPADPQSAGQKASHRAGFSENDTDPIAARSPPVSIPLASNTACDVRPPYGEASHHTIPSLRDVSGMQPSSPPSTLALPRRDDSGKSTITVIRHNSSRSSFTSKGDTLTRSGDFQYQDLPTRMTHEMTTGSAARAASEGLTGPSGQVLLAPVGRQRNQQVETS